MSDVRTMDRIESCLEQLDAAQAWLHSRHCGKRAVPAGRCVDDVDLDTAEYCRVEICHVYLDLT